MATPAQQIGGMKGQGKRDHILDVSCMMRAKESKGEPTIQTHIDGSACFDRLRIGDLLFNAVNAGADLKAINMIKEISETTRIHISGDPEKERCAEVKKTAGQGMGFVCKGTSLSVGLAAERSIPLENWKNDVVLPHQTLLMMLPPPTKTLMQLDRMARDLPEP